MALLKSRADFIPESPVHPKPFTPDIHGLIAWLETQDGEMKYHWPSCRDCLLRRFANVLGAPCYSGMGEFFNGPADEHVANPRPWTYSAALSRARAFAAKMGG